MQVALYISKNSVYKTLLTECYDIDRDATKYKGTEAVICHPPCCHWSALRLHCKRPIAEKQLALTALYQTRKFGGILEHPAKSTLWQLINRPTVSRPDTYGGYLISINQHWFGFPSQKRTYLYIIGLPGKLIPPFPLSLSVPTHFIGHKGRGGRQELPKSKRSYTTLALASWLIEIALLIEKNRERPAVAIQSNLFPP